VFEQLTSRRADSAGVLNSSTPQPIELTIDGKVMGRVAEKRPGHLSVEIDGMTLDASQKANLIRVIEVFLSSALK